jgi:hypothetical protein
MVHHLFLNHYGMLPSTNPIKLATVKGVFSNSSFAYKYSPFSVVNFSEIFLAYNHGPLNSISAQEKGKRFRISKVANRENVLKCKLHGCKFKTLGCEHALYKFIFAASF